MSPVLAGGVCQEVLKSAFILYHSKLDCLWGQLPCPPYSIGTKACLEGIGPFMGWVLIERLRTSSVK